MELLHRNVVLEEIKGSRDSSWCSFRNCN